MFRISAATEGYKIAYRYLKIQKFIVKKLLRLFLKANSCWSPT